MQLSQKSTALNINMFLDEFANKYGDRDEFLNLILELNSLKLSEKLGISLSKTLQLIKRIMEKHFKLTVRTVLKTDDIKKIYLKTMNIIESYLSTIYAKNKLRLFYPLPSKYEPIIKQRQYYSIQAKKIVADFSDEEIKHFRELLSKIKPLKKPRTTKRSADRIILTSDKKILNKLEARGINDFCDIFYVDSTDKERLLEYIQNYESIIFVSDDSYYPEVLDYSDNVEITSSNAKDSEIIPEKTLSFFTSNYETILAAAYIASKWFNINSEFIKNYFIKGISKQDIDELLNSLSLITKEGEYKLGSDTELDSYKTALEKLDDVLVEAETELNEYIKTKVTSSAVTIKGEQILNILRSSYGEVGGEKMKQYLPNEVIEIFDEAVRRAEEDVIKKLNLNSNEAILVEGIFPKEIKLPVEVDRKRAQELENLLRVKYSTRRYQILKDLTLRLEKHLVLANKIAKRSQEFDLFLGLGEFFNKYDLNTPNISSEFKGISFKDGHNLFLKEEELKGKLEVEPIDYSLGETPGNPLNTEKVVILTGANSGGKSRCIELIAQIAILSQSGLLAPAKTVFCGIFNEIHFFAKSRAMVSAGALENSLKKFAKIASSKDAKLALFDEVEAMTESGAAARILAGFIDTLTSNGETCTIMVSHLAKDILQLVKSNIRVDGIEAEGLDPNMNLIVNRKPRYNYLARSTPELIVERLYNLSKGSEKEFFAKILSEFKKSQEN
ncbi:MAG: hypothetical protein ACTSQY_01895 [Candidatus Odinarchaeia archaeon]